MILSLHEIINYKNSKIIKFQILNHILYHIFQYQLISTFFNMLLINIVLFVENTCK